MGHFTTHKIMLTLKNLFFTLATVVTLLLSFTSHVTAQGMVDGFFAPEGQISITAGYTRGTADAFYVGDRHVEGIPAHNEFTQNIFSLYAKYGITNRLTVIGSYAFIDLDGDGAADPINGLTEDSDLQDLQLAVKYQLASVDLGGSQLDFLVAGTGTIAGGYQNNGILSIGSGANAVGFSGGAHFSHRSGFFASAVAGYDIRGEAENTTEAAMGADFDVPNAIVGVAKIGYAGVFYGELFFDYQNSLDGVDIMGEGFVGNFPETQVNFARLGASVYYPVTPNLGLSLGYSTFVDGRNVADFSYLSTGITVSFGGN